MRHSILAATLILAALAGASSAPPSSPYAMPLTISSSGESRPSTTRASAPQASSTLVRFRAPWAMIDDAGADLTNLDIRDEHDSRMPYALVEGSGAMVAALETREVSARREADATHYLFEVAPAAGPLSARVRLEISDATFDATVTAAVSSTPDPRSSIVTARDLPIFRREGGENVVVEIPSTARPWKFLHLSVKPHDPAMPVGVMGARVESLAAGDDAGSEALAVRIISRIDGTEQSWIKISLPARNIMLSDLVIESEGAGDRRCRASLAVPALAGNEVILNTVAEGELFFSQRSAIAALRVGTAIQSREAVLIIDNGHERPIGVRALRATVRRPSLVLRLISGRQDFRVLHGAGTSGTRIDPGSLMRNGVEPILQLSDSAVTIGPSALIPTAEVEVAALIPELAGEIDTTDWEYRKEIGVLHPGVQRLDLDPEVIAMSRRDGGDLRIVEGSRQVPYIIFRSGIPATLRPAARQVQSGRVSRWELTLPAAPLPVAQITARTPSAIFRRSVRVLELVEDESGKRIERVLGEEHFTRDGITGQDLILTLRSTPMTSTLLVEVDNGDNSDLALEEFTVFYPGASMLFRQSSPGASWLYFGNHDAESPRYDLELIKNEILAGAPSEVIAGPIETANALPWWRSEMSKPAAWWIYWGALALVVVALILVIARLTKPVPPKAR